jgi:site-specific DNA recombinase
MKKVIIYCRVSTDEQSHGNSLDYQEMRLKEYCDIMHYEIFDIIRDDKSGKDFNRNGWRNIRQLCKSKGNKIESVIFLRWDRFARNLGLSLNEIEYFKKYKVELNSSEQPLDFNNPNSILLLSTYLAIPEVERNNISIRTKEGTYKAQLSGKCTNKAPKGYINDRSDERNKKAVINDKEALNVRWAFEEAAKGIKSVEMIRQEAKKRGLDLGKSAFPEMLKNQFYIGKVSVMAWGDKPKHWTNGIHQPLIDEETFWKVQELHFGMKKKKPKLCKTSTDEFYLRRFLKCPHCGKGLTGCYSKGNGGEYPYYKCPNCNKLNKNANKANELFTKYIYTLKPNNQILKLYATIFDEINSDSNKDVNREIAEAITKKKNEEQRMNKIDIDYADGKIEFESYNRMVEGIKIRILECDNNIFRLTQLSKSNLEVKFDYSMNLLANLGGILDTASLEDKINIVGLMFPNKIEFDGNEYRTNSYNKVLDVIFQETNHLQGQKKEETDKISVSSSSVPRAGIEPAWK